MRRTQLIREKNDRNLYKAKGKSKKQRMIENIDEEQRNEDTLINC